MTSTCTIQQITLITRHHPLQFILHSPYTYIYMYIMELMPFDLGHFSFPTTITEFVLFIRNYLDG